MSQHHNRCFDIIKDDAIPGAPNSPDNSWNNFKCQGTLRDTQMKTKDFFQTSATSGHAKRQWEIVSGPTPHLGHVSMVLIPLAASTDLVGMAGIMTELPHKKLDINRQLSLPQPSPRDVIQQVSELRGDRSV